MRIKYSDWEKHIRSISNDLNGQLKIVKRPAVGDRFEYLNSECSLEYKNGIIIIEQLFTKVDFENGDPGKLNFIFEFNNRFDFYLSINQRDLIDKIFSWKRIKTGDKDFDEKYSVQSNDKFIAQNIFKIDELRKLLKINKTIVLNISSKNRLTKIEMKNMVQKVYTLEEYNELLRTMKILIDKTKR